MKAHVLSLLLFAACGDDAVTPSIALVHGAWETSTAWDPVAIRLTADGYQVVAIDLPGRPGSPLAATDATLAGVDKVYIKTLRDQAVTPAAQAAMIATTEVRASFELDTGHAPFATDPGGLVAAIEQAIER